MSHYPGNDIYMGIDRVTGEPVMLSRFARSRHLFCTGSTRVGKSKLIEHMCRQDLIQWPNDRCPMVVLDPHGTLYKNLMTFVCAEGLDEWPIVPVDLSRGDLIVSYNLLRQRGGTDPSVVCRSFVDAILYAWGQANSNQTARLATWLHTLLMLAYERQHTLTEALQIIANPELRRLIVADVQDLVVRSVVQSVEQLREREFQERVESTLYRINRFLSGQVLRATFCQTGESLDMSRVLGEGQILLANLSVEGSHIHSEDASAFGSIMLSDLWSAANRRGKREEGELAPCYIYADEFQNFVGPTIAKGLAEASGFGLVLNAICQFPSQLVLHGQDVGQLVLQSVLANAQNKIVFKLEHPADLEMLTRILFRQSVDPNKIKDEILSPTVAGYELQYHRSFSHSTSSGTSRSVEHSHSRSRGRGISTSESLATGRSDSYGTTEGTSESEGVGLTDSESVTESESIGLSSSRGETSSSGTTTSESTAEQWSVGQSSGSSSSTSTGTNKSQTHNFSSPHEDFQEELDDYFNGALGEDEEDEFKRKWAEAMSVTESDSDSQTLGTNQSSSTSAGGSTSHGTAASRSYAASVTDSQSQSRGLARSQGRSRSTTSQKGTSRSVQQSSGHSVAASTGISHSETEQETRGVSEGFSESDSETEGETLSPMLMPMLQERVTSRQFKSVEEQLFEMSQLIDAQRVRQCFIRLASEKNPVPVLTPTIEPAETTAEWAEQRTTQLMKALPFVLPFEEANKNVRDRQESLVAKLHAQRGSHEPTTARRKIQSRSLKEPEEHG